MNLTNESSMWRSFVKNTFVDDGDIKLATNRFDRNTYCTVSRGNLCIAVCGANFVYNFSFFKEIEECLWLIDLLTPDFQFITKNIKNAILREKSDLKFWNFKLIFLRIYFLSIATFFLKLWLSVWVLNMFH